MNAEFKTLAADELKAVVSQKRSTDSDFRQNIINELLNSQDFVDAMAAKVNSTTSQA